MRKRAPKKRAALTDLELTIMDLLWQLEGGTVRDVVDAQQKKPPLAYTTVATVLKILEQKGVVRSRKQGRVLSYSAKLEREAYQTHSLDDMVDRVFAGDPLSLVTRLLDSKKMTRADLDRLQSLVAEQGKNGEK
jgi:predicted transcriptional regulator